MENILVLYKALYDNIDLWSQNKRNSIDDFNEFTDKLIEVKQKSCWIHEIENPNDKAGIDLCIQTVNDMRRAKEVYNLRMDIIDYTGLFKIFPRTSFNYEKLNQPILIDEF
jgi:hypothetical protein